jgi:hypothetical protein
MIDYSATCRMFMYGCILSKPSDIGTFLTKGDDRGGINQCSVLEVMLPIPFSHAQSTVYPSASPVIELYPLKE